MRLLPTLIILLFTCALPASAQADGAVSRAAFGHGTIKAGAAPDCTTPASNPQQTQAECSGGVGGICIPKPNGFGSRCTLSLVAQAPAGWRFDRWAGSCAAAGTGTCTLMTSDTACSGGPEPVCDDPVEFFHAAVAVFVNTRAPTTTFATAPAQDSVVFSATPRQTIRFATDEDGEAPTFQCQLDAGAFAACANPHATPNLADGFHQLCVKAKDASGAEGPITCRRWRQELPPTATIKGPDARTAATTAELTYGSNKPAATFECRLDGAPFKPCAATGSRFEGLAEGAHAFEVRAGFLGQVSPVSTHKWTIDRTPPETTITSGPDGATVDVAPTFAFASSEDPASFVCSVDGGPAEPCASPFTTPPLLGGAHTVAIAAVDDVGNTDPTPATATFTLKTGLATLVDADHDGFPESLDCNDRAAHIHPGAPEVPGDKVDENCDGVLAPFPRVAAVLTAGGKATATKTTFRSFVLTGITEGAKVQVRCSGKQCPFKQRTLKVRKGRATAKRFTVAPGATVDVWVTAPRMIGKVMRLPIVRNRFPTMKTLCVDPGARKAKRCPA